MNEGIRRRGFCVWLTGLPGSGKSTTAEALVPLLEARGWVVRLLDGDSLRKSISAGLGFSKDDRDRHIRRVGRLGTEITERGEVAVVAVISPYRSTREECRAAVGEELFIEVFVDTPLSVCEERDPKGLYARARAEGVPNVTGFNDPYETPTQPEIRLDTVAQGADENAQRILEILSQRGLL